MFREQRLMGRPGSAPPRDAVQHKNHTAGEGRRYINDSLMSMTAALLPILLDARGAQAGEAMLVDRILPGEEFLHRQRIAAARLFKRQQPATHGGYNLGLASDDPTLGARGRQVGNRQRTAVRSDDVLGPWSQGLGHEFNSTHSTDQLRSQSYSPPLKIWLSPFVQLGKSCWRPANTAISRANPRNSLKRNHVGHGILDSGRQTVR